MPGRVIGMSITVEGTPGLRLAMQVGSSPGWCCQHCTSTHLRVCFCGVEICVHAHVRGDNYTCIACLVARGEGERAAHPPRQGDQQHLYCASASGQCNPPMRFPCSRCTTQNTRAECRPQLKTSPPRPLQTWTIPLISDGGDVCRLPRPRRPQKHRHPGTLPSNPHSAPLCCRPYCRCLVWVTSTFVRRCTTRRHAQPQCSRLTGRTWSWTRRISSTPSDSKCLTHVAKLRSSQRGL